jgi:MoaA/NifB/PqqE/SkfB family radical SAM enzyme
MTEIAAKALKLNVPLNAQIDLTYRCNERCVHCYLDHDDHGEMTTAEIKDLLDQMAEAGVFYLNLSGGEIMMRKDFFEILEHARLRTFCVKLKTNAVLIRKKEAQRLRALGVESIQISIYSHRPEVHDAITKMPGSFRQSIEAARLLRAEGLNVTFANVLMTENAADYQGVRALAAELGIKCSLDPTVTPMMDGDRSVLQLNVDRSKLHPSSVTSRSFARYRRAWTKRLWTCCRAARATPPATSLPTATCIPACNFPCLAETCGARNLRISGAIRRSSAKCDRSRCAICPLARSARMARLARDARGSPISKETCAGRPSRIAKNPTRELEFPARISNEKMRRSRLCLR